MGKRQYIITMGMSGYTPNRVEHADTLEEAIQIAKDEKEWWLEQNDPMKASTNCVVRGNIRKDLQYTIEFPNSDTLTDHYIEIDVRQ
jgi:hypothetical protein